MAHIEVNALSVNLAGSFEAQIFMPELSAPSLKQKFPVIWFMHEDGGSPHDLLAYSAVLEQLAVREEVFVIAPALAHSLGTDMAYGTDHEAFLSDECIRIFRFMYPLSDKKEDNYTLGIGSGAYAAVKLAMHHPDVFGTGISVNGELDIAARCEQPDTLRGGFCCQTGASLKAVFGDIGQVRGSRDDLYEMARKSSSRFYLACSTAATVYEDNLHLAELLSNVETDFGEREYGDAVVNRLLERAAADLFTSPAVLSVSSGIQKESDPRIF